jgi:7SK snRNA methylphosphate capping enzyme
VQDPPSDGTPGTPGACSAFDTILCLSTTKWVHLHSGDAGLLCLFHRMHAALRPQGRLLLEPQPWSSYRKAAGVAPHVLRNYGRIQVKPSSFREVLLHQVGFVSCEDISTTDTLQPGAPVGFAQGARGGSKRPLLLLTKA